MHFEILNGPELAASKTIWPIWFILSLKRHFEKALSKDGRKVAKKPSTLPKPKLAVGTYKNPATNEKVEKIKRNPRQLDQWIEEYGFQTVRTWKVWFLSV